MSTHKMTSLGLAQDAPKKAPAAPLPLPASVKKDVFLTALLETPTTERTRRSPLEWAAAGGLHVAIIAVLILIPLYTTGTIQFNEFEETPLVAPPPPAPPPPPAAAPRAIAPKIVNSHAHLTFKIPKVIAPTSIPKKLSSGDETAEAAPDLGGVVGGVPGGVIGGQIGGGIGGIAGGTGPAAPPPPPAKPLQKKIVRVGSNLKAPRQTYNVAPQYPALARQTHVFGTVVVDAVIDEKGNVVQARAVSGHPLLIDAALKAVLQWKYEPTSLNGQPISVELQVLVNFNTKE
jgi:protein TonB